MGVLAARQVVFDGALQIRARDLEDERIKAALARKGGPASGNFRKPNINLFRYLNMRCTMSAPLRQDAPTARCRCMAAFSTKTGEAQTGLRRHDTTPAEFVAFLTKHRDQRT